MIRIQREASRGEIGLGARGLRHLEPADAKEEPAHERAGEDDEPGQVVIDGEGEGDVGGTDDEGPPAGRRQ